MSSRFLTNAFVVVFGGFVVIMSRSFHPQVIGWLGFAFGIAVIAVSVLAQLDTARGLLQRAIDAGLVALGGLAMGFGVGAAGSAQRWTIFAFALGWAGLALGGLLANEVTQWRAQYGLGRLHWFPTMESRKPLAGADGDRTAPTPTYERSHVA